MNNQSSFPFPEKGSLAHGNILEQVRSSFAERYKIQFPFIAYREFNAVVLDYDEKFPVNHLFALPPFQGGIIEKFDFIHGKLYDGTEIFGTVCLVDFYYGETPDVVNHNLAIYSKGRPGNPIVKIDDLTAYSVIKFYSGLEVAVNTTVDAPWKQMWDKNNLDGILSPESEFPPHGCMVDFVLQDGRVVEGGITSNLISCYQDDLSVEKVLPPVFVEFVTLFGRQHYKYHSYLDVMAWTLKKDRVHSSLFKDTPPMGWVNLLHPDGSPDGHWPPLNAVVGIHLKDGQVRQAVTSTLHTELRDQFKHTECPVFVCNDKKETQIFTLKQVSAWRLIRTNVESRDLNLK